VPFDTPARNAREAVRKRRTLKPMTTTEKINSPRRRKIPSAAVNRLPVYLQILTDLQLTETTQVSSDQLAALANVNAAKVRKDLSYLGTYGTRGVGYEVAFLIYQIKRELGLLTEWKTIVVGAGNLGAAITVNGGFASRGFPVIAIFDVDPRKVGTRVGDLVVRNLDEMDDFVQANGVHIGVLAVPSTAAQSVADDLIAAGIGSLLNFAPIVLTTPKNVAVRNVDLGVELQILGYHEQMRGQSSAQHNPVSV
jgi:redox-sensing transcriptional repressor